MKRKLFSALPRGGIVTSLLAAVIALVVGNTTVWAQKDVTSQYITNAKLSDGTNGWTKTFTKNEQTDDPKDAFSVSMRGNNTTGYATEAYAGWGKLIQTDYSMKQTITLPAGNYTLVCYAFYRQGAEYNTNATKSLAYLKAGNQQVAIKTLGSITAKSYANTQAEGANVFDSKMYRNTLNFTISNDNTSIEIGVEGTFDEPKCWCIVGMFELINNDILATVDSPFDVTGYITNPGFEYRDISGWTSSGSMKYQNNNWANKSGIGFAEQWQASPGLPNGSMTQEITVPQTGLYKLSVNAHNIIQSSGNAPGTGMFLTANETKVEIGAYNTYSTNFVINENKKLNLGIKLDGCTGNWIAFDNFRLQFCGDVVATLNTLRTEAQDLVDNNILPTSADAKAALQQVISSTVSPDDYLAAIEQVTEAIETFKSSIASNKLYFFNAASKQFLTSGNWWGTHAALDDDGMPISIEMSPNGKYYLSTTSAFNGKYVNGPWMDGNNKQEWSIDAVTGTDYFTLKNADNKYLYYTGTPNVADETDAAPTGEAYYWKIFSKEQLIARLSEATSERPVDATFFMTNGKVRYGWSASIQGTTEWGTNSFHADAVGLYNGGCNSYTQWHKKFDNYQSLENLPNGKYTVTVKGLYTTSNGFSSIPYLYANNAKASLTPRGVEQDPVSKELVDDSHLVGPLTVFVTDGKLQVGIKSDEAASWVIWREFTIKYLGTEVTPDDANALISSIPEGTMNNDVRTALTSAKTIFEGDETWENYQALANAIADAQASIDAYEKAGNVLPKMKELIDATNVYTQEAYNNYYGTWQAKYEAGTLTTEEANALEDPTVITGVHAENTVDDFLTSAWDFAPLIWEGFHVNTWSTEGDTDGSGFRVPFYEYWTGDGNSLVARTATATMSGLEAGDYAVSAWVRVRLKNGATAPATGITMQVNDGTEADVCDGTKIGNSNFYLKKVFAFGTVGQNGNLSIKFNVADGTNISWLSFKNVKFEKAIANIAAFKAAQPTEAVVLNLTGAEFLASLDGTTYVQDATGGIAIPNFTISGATVDKAKLSGQLYGTYEADNKFIVKDTTVNAVVAKEGEATVYTLTPQEAIKTENIYRLVKLETMNVAKLNDQAGTLLVNDGDTEVYINESLFEGDVNDYMRTGDVLNSITGVTFFDHTNYNNLAPRTSDDIVPLLWGANEVENGTVAQGVDISGDNAIDLSTANKLTRMANLAAGDVLNLNVALEAGSTYDNITVSTSDGRAVYTIPVLEAATTVEIPVTAFMESDIQRHGLKISAGKSTTMAKFITVTTDKYTDVENSIWLGAAPQNYQGSYLRLHAIHFDDVRVGDMLKNTGATPELTFHKNAAESRALSGETIVLDERDVEFLYDHEMTIVAAADLTKVAYILGDDPRNDIVETQEGEAYAQGDKVLADGMIMTFGGDEPEGKKYEFKEQYPPVNKFGTATKGISQQPTDAEGKAYAEAEKNVPTKGTYYQFDALKDGQLEVSIDLESGKKLYVVDETGEPVEGFNGVNVTDSKVTIAAKSTKTYTVFAPESDLKYYGFKFTPANSEAGNKAKDIATFKLLPAEGVADTLLLKDAVVNYIKGDDVFVSDATGAIDIYQTHIQFYVGQVLNGYIVGKNGFDRKLVYLPQLQRTEATKYGQFKVTEDVTPEPAVISVADALKQENLNKFVKLQYVEQGRDKRGFPVLIDPQSGESIHVEDHFNVFYELGALMESVEGIVGIDNDSTFILWPTSKEGTVISDGFTKMVETELDVTNKDIAKDKNNDIVGISITLAGTFNAGSGSAKAGVMTSKGYKLRTANGGNGEKKNSATFTVNEGQKVFSMKINAIANYAVKDETNATCIKVTKVEVDGQEVAFRGGEFPAKGAADCGSLIVNGINAEKDITIYFDNSNAAGTQLNAAWEIVCHGNKVYTTDELNLMADARKLAEDREAVAVGLLDDAIEAAEAGNTNGLQAAIDQFKADNADMEKDETSKVKTNGWKKFDGTAAGVCATQFAPAITTFDGRNAQLAECYEETTTEGMAVTRTGTIIYQDITGLTNGTYKVGFYGNAFFTPDRNMTSDMSDGATDVAYVFANDKKAFISAKRATSTKENAFSTFTINITDGIIKVGMGKEKAGTNWHTMQIYQLTWFTTAKEAYAAEKNDLSALIDEAKELLASDQIGGKKQLEAAVAKANEALESIRLNVAGIHAEVAKMQKAIEKFNDAGKVFIQHVATGKYIAAGANWGTRAILNDNGLDFAVATNEDGTMTFDSQVTNGGANHFLRGGIDVYVDGAVTAWTVEKLANGNYTISDGTNYLTAVENLDNFNGYIVMPSETADEWRFVTVGERTEALAAATSDKPLDATYFILGANNSRNDLRNSNWTVSSDCTNKNLSGGDDTNRCAESYHSTFTVSQEVKDLPAGTYTLTLQGFYRQDDNANEAAPSFFANNVSGLFGPLTGSENSMAQASASFTAGNYLMEAITFTVAEGESVTFGVKGVGTHQWIIWDNFQLKYLGNSGTPTAIDDIEISETPAASQLEDGAVYTLNGVKVSGTLKPGLYIKNGKKVIVK